MHYVVKKGTTNFSVELYIIDNTDGTPELGVVFDTSGIDLNYRREGSALVTVTEATLAALTTAHSDGGFKEIGNGRYRFDLPDAAFATGKQNVTIGGTITGMIVMPVLCQLVDYDPEDSVRLGLTALPNAAAEASGGLYTQGSGSGQIAQDSSGRINTNLVAISSSTSYVSTLNTALADYSSYGYFNANVYAINTSASYVSTMDSFFADYMSNGYVTANVAYISGSASNVGYLDTICSDYSSGYLNANVAAINSNTGNVSSFDTACGDYSTYGFNANVNYIESSDATDQIGDAVWDEEVTTGHTTADSAGAKLNSAATGGGGGGGDATEAKQDTIIAALAVVDAVVDNIIIDTATLGSPSGADFAADIAAIKAETAVIVADTNELQSDDIPTTLAAIISDTNAILIDTGTTIPATITTAQADLDIITGADGVVLLSGTQASIDAVEADTNILQVEWTNGGRLDLILDTAAAGGGGGDATEAKQDTIIAAIGTPVGVDLVADVAAVKAETTLIVADTTELQTDDIPGTLATIAGYLDAEIAAILVDTGTTLPALIGTPAVDLSADIAAIKAETALVVADTNELQTDDVPGIIAALNDFDPATDAVANVTLTATTTTNADMRGTDSAALASVATEARLAELDAANLPADIDAILADTNELQVDDIPALIAALNDPTSAAIATSVLTTAMTESYAALAAEPTLAEILYEVRSKIMETSISATTVTSKKLDGSTTATTSTLDDATTPTSTTRAS